MQLASRPAFPEPLLAAMWQLSENSRLGFRVAGSTLHQGFGAGKYLIGIGDTASVVRYAWLESLKAQQQNAGGASTPPGTPYSPINLGSTTITGTFDPFYGNLGAKGATIYADPSNCGSCEWIQGVKSTDTDGGKQFIDGHEVMGSVPLYPRQGGPTNELNDQPYRHGAVTWTAISVVGAVDNANHSFTAMGAIKWGFSISASGRLSISGPVRASAAEERGVLRQVMKEYTWTIR